MKFGTSGLRGLSVDLVGAGSSTYANAFGRYLLESGTAKAGDAVFIGRDFRESSPAIVANCALSLSSLGFTVIDCGPVPTPALALYSLKNNSASLMVTGSHIPADRNGIKFYKPNGEIDKADEAAITKLTLNMRCANVRIGEPPIIEDHTDKCLDLFYQRNTRLFSDDALAGLKIGVYQHSTVARDLIVKVLVHYGAEVVPLGRSSGFIPVDTEAISDRTIALLEGWVNSHGLDAIVSADGDGDRPLVADERGVPLRGDLLGLMVAEFLRADSVATPVTSNSGIESLGIPVTRTKVGSPFVISAMREALAAGKERVIGFEANGGVLLGSPCDLLGLDALPTRDCMLPILVALSRIASLKKPLSEVTDRYALPFTASDRLENFATDNSMELLDYLCASDANLAFFLKEIGEVSSKTVVDGLRVALKDGRVIHFRASGNAPEIRCYVEAATEAAADELLELGLGRLKRWVNADREGADGFRWDHN
ncbi:phosphomannomutase [Sinorhizobium meliloti]|uniref:phosphomannomutase n=1 Tax=Rhizobium meliloti TaxID=382 RepID=UPI000FDAAB04|nr:phosphomannomutase [Sinorhizobium meliloti]RVP15538.1 phosphomannomutase [Sinorhizobium meliloti]